MSGKVSKNSEAGWGQDRVKFLPCASSVKEGGREGTRWAGWIEEKQEGETHLMASLKLSIENAVGFYALFCLPCHNTRQWSTPSIYFTVTSKQKWDLK